MAAKRTRKHPHQVIGERVKEARESRGLRQADVVAKLHELGFESWWQTKLTKLERGETKRIAVDDVLALAAALGEQPALLLSPPDGIEVEMTSKLRIPAADFRAWLRSRKPLRSEDHRIYFLGKLVPDDEIPQLDVTISGARAQAAASGREGETNAR